MLNGVSMWLMLVCMLVWLYASWLKADGFMHYAMAVVSSDCLRWCILGHGRSRCADACMYATLKHKTERCAQACMTFNWCLHAATHLPGLGGDVGLVWCAWWCMCARLRFVFSLLFFFFFLSTTFSSTRKTSHTRSPGGHAYNQTATIP